MENKLLIVIILLFLIIIFLISIILIVLFVYYKKQNSAEEVLCLDPKRKMKKVSFEPLNGYCLNHEKEKAAGICNICEKPFCDSCLQGHETLNFCHEHYEVFLSNKWIEFKSFKTTPATPYKGTLLYKFKNHLWDIEKLPTYIITHYRINYESDEIESIVCLNVPELIRSDIEEKFTKFESEFDS